MRTPRALALIAASIAISISLAASTFYGASPAATSQPAFNWPQYRGANRDGIFAEPVSWPKNGPKQAWKVPVGQGYSSVAVFGDQVYSAGNDGKNDTVYCINIVTGKEAWHYSWAAPARKDWPGTRGTPAVDGKYVFFLSGDAQLFCLSAKDGTLVWSKDLKKEYKVKSPGWGNACSPLMMGDNIVVDAGTVFMFKKDSGKEVWKANYGDQAGYSSPILLSRAEVPQLLLVFQATKLLGLDPATGKELCSREWRTQYDVNAAMPVIDGDKVFISSGYGTGCAMLKSNPTFDIVWKNKEMRNHFNTCVLYKGYLYGFDESELRCLDAADGTVKWKHGGLGKGSLMVADGKLLILSETGDLVLANAGPEAFKADGTAKVLNGASKCWTAPVLADGRVFCRDQAGDLVCMDLSGK